MRTDTIRWLCALGLWFVAAGCVVDEGVLDGLPCGEEGQCLEGYTCVREPCGQGRMCSVCRKGASPADGGDGSDASDGGGDRTDAGPDGGDPASDAGDGACSGAAPPCKTLPDCQDQTPVCQNGAWTCAGGFEYPERSCDGVDNDCDGKTDNGIVCLFAGCGRAGFSDGQGSAACFDRPRGLAALGSGGAVLADRGNHAVRLLAPEGAVSVLAGTGAAGATDGPGAQAAFREPTAVAVDADGSILVADSQNDRIRRVAFDVGHTVSTVAGSAPGFKDGPAAEALFFGPQGVAADSAGIIYVADTENHCLRKIVSGTVSTLAGSCTHPGFKDGAAGEARFNRPTDLYLLASGRLLVSDESNHAIRSVSAEGQVQTVAGAGESGYLDGAMLQARFFKPAGLFEDPADSAYLVADSGNQRVRRIDTLVRTLMGSGQPGASDGPLLEATFRQPSGLCRLSGGKLLVSDTQNHAIRVVNP